jgi:hypothetical protein
MKHFKRRYLVLAAVLTATSSIVSAQALDPSTQPATQPADDSAVGPTGMSAQAMLDQMLRAGSGQGAKPLQPLPEGPNPNAASTAPPLLPGGARALVQPTTRPAAAAGLREGSYIVDRTGHLERLDGESLLGLDKLPSERRQAAASTSRTLVFRDINGTVTEYRGKNWVLLTLDPSVNPNSGNPMAPPPPAPAPVPANSSQPTRTMSAEDVLGQMLRPASPGGSSTAQPLPPPTDGTGMNAATGAVAPGAPSLPLLREGTFIVDRVGRLTKSPDGSRSEFTFETDGRSMQDPPLILMPCVKTSTMEDSVKATNQDLRFRITGLVTEYRGRNYLLPDRVVVIPDVEQQF